MNLKQILKRAVAALLLAALTVGPFFGVPAEAAAKPPVDVSLTYGNNGLLESGINVPFNVTLTSNSTDFEGSVWLIVPLSRNDIAAYERKVSLAAGSSKTYNFICLSSVIANKCCIRVTDSKGKKILEKDFQLNYDLMNQYARVGILSDDYNALSSISGSRLKNLQDLTILTEKFTEKTFPEDSRALDFMDALIISDFSSDRLSDAQRKSLLEWVSNGGLLIVGTGTSASKVLKGFPELSFIELDELKTVSTDLGASESSQFAIDLNAIYSGRSYEDSQAIAVYSAIDKDFFNSEGYLALLNSDKINEYIYDNNKDAFINYAWFDYHGETYATSQSRLSAGELDWEEKNFKEYCVNYIADKIVEFSKTLNFDKIDKETRYYKTQITEPLSDSVLIYGHIENEIDPYAFVGHTPYGNGEICTAATDISKEPFITSEAYFSTISYLIEFFKGPILYNNYISGGYGYSSDNLYQAERLAEELTFGNLLPLPAYFLIFVTYTTLGFVAFFFLKKRKRSILLWPVQISLALIATVLILICSLTTKINKPVVNSIKFSEVSDKVVNESTFSGLILPKNKQYKIDFSKNYFPQLIRTDNYYHGYNTNFEELNYNIAWLDDQGSNPISLRGKAALAKETLMFTRSKPTDGYDVAFNASYSDYKLSGYVQNNTEKTFENCAILADYMVYPLGTLTPGSRIDLSKIVPVSVFYINKNGYYLNGDASYIAKIISGLQDDGNFGSYFMGLKNNDYKKDYLMYEAGKYIIESDGLPSSGIIVDTSYAESINNSSQAYKGGYYGGYRSYSTLEEIYNLCNLNSDGCPSELITQPYLICFDFETAESLLSNTKTASENILEVVMVPGNMTENN
ncbi:MAG: hypothetical protein K6F63_10025 [Lachnospiraceae bacterium]|nr:hypothetical protein [Lachnospiraceae bacterium]